MDPPAWALDPDEFPVLTAHHMDVIAGNVFRAGLRHLIAAAEPYPGS